MPAASCSLRGSDYGPGVGTGISCFLLLETLCIILYKKWSEDQHDSDLGEPPRDWSVFLLDNSKQLIGFGALHVFNIHAAWFLGSAKDPCRMYFYEVVTGCIVGTFLCWVLLRLFTIIIKKRCSPEFTKDFANGDYSDIDRLRSFSKTSYFKQLALWLCVVLVSKILTLIFLPHHWFLAHVWQIVPSYFEDAFVMILTPTLLNPFQFYVTDCYLQREGSRRLHFVRNLWGKITCKRAQEPETGPAETLLPTTSVSAGVQSFSSQKEPELSQKLSDLVKEISGHGLNKAAEITTGKSTSSFHGDRKAAFLEFFGAAEAEGIRKSFAQLRSGVQEDVQFPYQAIRQLPELKEDTSLLAFRSSIPSKVWNMLDKREKRDGLKGRSVVVIGAGPVGLRLALEAALSGAKVTVLEKRHTFDRLNRMKLWEWVKEDLIKWGAREKANQDIVFGPRSMSGVFGSDNKNCNIGIAECQCLFLKCCLLLGVNVHLGVEFAGIEPQVAENGQRKIIGQRWSETGQRLDTQPFAADALFFSGGSGVLRKSTVTQELMRKVGTKFVPPPKAVKASLGIVANFKNSQTDAERFKLEQFDWSYQFEKKIWQQLKDSTGADLELIACLKGPYTHYVVMTPRKECLTTTFGDRNPVLRSANPTDGNGNATDPLDPSNVDQDALRSFAKAVMQQQLSTREFRAGYLTKKEIPTEFTDIRAHHDQTVNIFDFSKPQRLDKSMGVYPSDSGAGLPVFFVGDSLLEPFWVTGLGTIRGFFSVLDSISSLELFFCQGKDAAIKNSENAYKCLKTLVLPESRSHVLKTENEKNWGLSPSTRYKEF